MTLSMHLEPDDMLATNAAQSAEQAALPSIVWSQTFASADVMDSKDSSH
jgi:hypothetical protein